MTTLLPDYMVDGHWVLSIMEKIKAEKAVHSQDGIIALEFSDVRDRLSDTQGYWKGVIYRLSLIPNCTLIKLFKQSFGQVRV